MSLREKIRQAMCLHWFDPPTTREFSEYVGAIICCQQKSYRVTAETRVCSKCGLTDSRKIGDPVFEGWD
jgi:hypothetical protein